MTTCLIVLISALRAVESANGADPHCGRNELQITRICVRDADRIAALSGSAVRWTLADRLDLRRSEELAVAYLSYWGAAYTRRTGRAPTAETYARIWNGDPDGWRKPTTAAYWRKVKAKLETKHKEAK